MKNRIFNVKFKSIMLILVLSLVFSTMMIGVEAQRNTGDSVYLGPKFLERLLHHKTIDMSDAKDKTKIPNVSFAFELVEISDETKFGIGQILPCPEYCEQIVIKKGSLGGNSLHVSDVNFNENDEYYEVIGQYLSQNTIDYDNYAQRCLVFDAFLINCWGTMVVDNDAERAIFRAPTAEEKADADLMQLGRDNNWPEDVIAYRYIPLLGTEECLYNYDFNTFSYVDQFGLRERMECNFMVDEIAKDIILRQTVDANGNYLTITKPVFGPGDIDKMVEEILKYNVTTDEIAMYRFILKEVSTTNSEFEVNKQEKIVDIVVDLWGDYKVRIFDSVEQANAFYSTNDYEYDTSFYITEFVNCYKLYPVPETGDNINTAIFKTIAVVSAVALISLTVLKIYYKRKEK